MTAQRSSPDQTEPVQDEADIRQAIGAARIVREAAERRRVRKLGHPDKEPALTALLVRMLRDLDAIEHQGRLARTAVDQSKKARNGRATATVRAHARKCEERARKLRIEIDAERQKQLATVWAANAVSESEALAELRGEQVSRIETEVSDWKRDVHGGMVRFRGQPRLKTERARTARMLRGLLLAFQNGVLDGGPLPAAMLLEAGKRYSRSFERVNAMRTPNRDAPRVDGGGANKDAQEIYAEAVNSLISLRAGLSEEQEMVLDLICGLDHSTRQVAGILGRRKGKIEQLLRDALTLAVND